MLNRLIYFICLFVLCQFVPLQTTLRPYPGFNRYQAQIILPFAPPFPPNLNVTVPLSQNSGQAVNCIVALNQISWIGMALFSYSWSQPTNSQLVISLNSYRTINTTYHRLITFKVNIGVFSQVKYTFLQAQTQFIQASTAFVDQVIPVVNHQYSPIGIIVEYEDRFDESVIIKPYLDIYICGGQLQPYLSTTLTFAPLLKLTYSTMASRGYNIMRFKYKLYNISVITLQKLVSYYSYVSLQMSGLDIYNSQINNNEAACPLGHFYGINGIFQVYANNRPVSIRTYVISFLDMLGLFLSYYSCYLRCPINNPYFYNWSCNPFCPPGYYVGPDIPASYFVCETCSPPCANCFGNAFNCTSCLINYELSQQYNASSGANRECKCLKGQYGVPLVSCTNCNTTIPYCVSCTNGTYCLNCDLSLIYNELTNACECPSGTTMVTKYITYTQNGIVNTVPKIICISAVLSQDCSDRIVTGDPLTVTGLSPFGLCCICSTGSNYVDNECQ